MCIGFLPMGPKNSIFAMFFLKISVIIADFKKDFTKKRLYFSFSFIKRQKMRHVLIINGHQKYDKIAEGFLNKRQVDVADKFLSSNGFVVKHSHIESGYDIKEEVEKFAWAYYFIIQFPLIWLGLPWKLKKYIDEVITAGQGKSTYIDDGRSDIDPNKAFGSGGLMRGKRYMLSLTCHTPKDEFSNPEGFYQKASIDEINMPLHRVFKFCGASQLQTYTLYDVYKGNLDMSEEKIEFEKILKKNFL